MNRFIFIVGLFLMACLSLSAQQIPINGGTIDYVGQFDTELRELVGHPIPQITQMGRSILDDSAVLMLIFGSLSYAFIAGYNIAGFLWNLLLRYAFLSLMLACYDSPLPWFGGVSFHSLIPELAKTVAAVIDLSSVNLLIAQLDQIRAGLAANPANPLNFLNGFVSLGISLDAGLLYFLSFGTSLVGYALVAFLGIFGPISIGLSLLPPLEWMLGCWIKSMITYSFFRVSNAAAVFLGTRLLLWFFARSIHADYSIGHWLFLMPFVVALSLIFLILSLLAFIAARDAFNGSASMSSPLSSVARFAAAVV